MQTTAKAKYIRPFNRQIKQIDTSMFPTLVNTLNGEVQTQVLDEVDLGIVNASSEMPLGNSTSQNGTFKQKLQNFWTKTKTQAKTVFKSPITYVVIAVVVIASLLITGYSPKKSRRR
ncbi:hypothetical protein [Corallibacter sp.]|uniref:hypothetical protein n=1 Tax=Corallibacter sp. TaxID=2038084 RepID=UPI003A925124